jgi:hypothetical protein
VGWHQSNGFTLHDPREKRAFNIRRCNTKISPFCSINIDDDTAPNSHKAPASSIKRRDFDKAAATANAHEPYENQRKKSFVAVQIAVHGTN